MTKLTKQNLLSKVYAVKAFFEAGKIPTLAHHEIHPDLPIGSKERYLYFTLPVSLNFQRSSPAMRKAAYETRHDPETTYLFDPSRVVETAYEKVQQDLIKHKLWLQKNKHTQIRYTISQTLQRDFEGDPREIFQRHETCVQKVTQHLQTNKKDFPYLNGPKMCHYRMYILSNYTDLQLSNKHNLSIIPDTHIQQSSVQLGIVDEGATPQQVIDARYELLAGETLTPVEMHPILRNRSRNNFLPAV